MRIPWKHRRDNRTNMKFGHWLLIAEHSTMTAALDIKRFTRPRFVGDKRTPENLNTITMGQLIELSMARTIEDSFYYPCRVILGLTQQQTDKSLAVDVVRWAGWCCAQIDKINEAFSSLHRDFSIEELQAGAKKLNFGIFGLIDWYAQRMGIMNHEEVESVPWVRVFECMKMDLQKEEYQRRLNNIVAQKYRQRRM